MKVELKANGKTVQAEITKEQAKILGLVEERSRTGYERVEKRETYYVINTEDDSMINITEFNDQTDERCYNTSNYYSDKTIAENNARADRLLCCLRQWQALYDRPITSKDWKDGNVFKYSVDYDYFNNMVFVTYTTRYRCLNNVYFTSEEKAQEAIEVFKDELIWYFTEYVQRLDEVKNG